MRSVDWLDRAAQDIEEALESTVGKGERRGLKRSLKMVQKLMDEQWWLVVDAGDRSVRDAAKESGPPRR